MVSLCKSCRRDHWVSQVIITAALTGAVTSRLHTPYVPLTQEEIVEEAIRCEAAGAAVTQEY